MYKKVGGERGFGLIEVLISLALLGIIVVAFTMAINIALRAVLITDERNIAESLAKSQIEYIKEQGYDNANDNFNNEAIYSKIDTSEYPSFALYSENRAGEAVEDIIGIPWNTGAGVMVALDEGIQKVKLIIKNNDEDVLVLEDYKVDR